MAGMPTDLKALWDRDGYIVLPELFRRDEVAAWKDEIRRVLPTDGNHRKDGVWVGVTLASPLIRAANADPRVVAALNAVIGPDVEFLSDKLVFKSAGMDYGSPWHQDWSYWYGAHKTSVWIALDDATVANGCLRLIPGSHRTQVPHTGDASDGKGFGYRLDPKSVDESRAVTAEVPAGGAVIFHDLLLHASFQNSSGKDRWALISTYRDAAVPDETYGWAKAAFIVSGKRAGAAS